MVWQRIPETGREQTECVLTVSNQAADSAPPEKGQKRPDCPSSSPAWRCRPFSDTSRERASRIDRMLIAMSGLPGVGKTTIAMALARALGAVHLRMDSIEQAMREAGIEVEGQGYAVGYAVGEDNLRVGRTVIADCVDPWPLTRRAWQGVAQRAGVRVIHVEIICSDKKEHRRRVESRRPDIPGHVLPTWAEVLERDYRPWESEHLVIDTAKLTVEQSVLAIRSAAQI